MKSLALKVVVALAVLLVVFGAFLLYRHYRHATGTGVTDFETCVAAGNPSLDSYPEQCIAADGRHFTKEY